MKEHIYLMLSTRRRLLGISQHELAARAGLRREKINRVESKGEELDISELCRVLDAVGLELAVLPKADVKPPLPASGPSPARRKSSSPGRAGRLAPEAFHKASFIDGSKARVLNWGKVPG